MNGLFQRLLTMPGRPSPAQGSPLAPTTPRDDLVICEGCDAAYRRQPLASGEDARCDRCQSIIGRGHRLGIEAQLALAVAALIIFLMGNASPIVTLDLRGVNVPVTLYRSILETWQAGEEVVAMLAAATALVFPFIVIVLRIHVLLPMVQGRRAAGFVLAMRMLRWFTRWSMVEVFMLGTLIAVVRSAGLAAVIPGVGIFSYAVLTVLLTANQAAGLHRIWHRSAELPE